MSETQEHATLDLSKGIAASALTDGGMILGRVGDELSMPARRRPITTPALPAKSITTRE